MSADTINHNALTHLVEADAVSSAIAQANGDIWSLSVKVGDKLKIVMAKNSGKARVWRKLDTLAKYLKELGMDTFEIDVSNYDPSQKSLRRPDSASTLKRTHDAHKSLQQHNIESIEKNIEQEETREFTNNTDRAIELAKQKWEERRARILQQENPRAK